MHWARNIEVARNPWKKKTWNGGYHAIPMVWFIKVSVNLVDEIANLGHCPHKGDSQVVTASFKDICSRQIRSQKFYQSFFRLRRANIWLPKTFKSDQISLDVFLLIHIVAY
jgi:hypothetical protein